MKKIYSFTVQSIKMITDNYKYGWWISPWVNVKRRDTQYIMNI